jgi:Domain of unknown function (DUF4252)
MFKPVLPLAALLGVSSACWAQAGFFDFGEIPGLDAEPTVQIDLTPAMLGFVAEAARPNDPETADLLAGIEGVRVFVYEDVGNDMQAVLRFIDDTSKKLDAAGWHRTVLVQEGDEKVRIYMKLATAQGATASNVSGITVMVADGSGEAVFINVAGEIEPAQFGRLAAAFDLDEFGGLTGLGGVQPDRDAP